ncbi:MAG: hypothetical protein GW917_01615 [Bdellovibrionales bacterium]|nr:hypothetical protein [Bdellovibrionales bacterium]
MIFLSFIPLLLLAGIWIFDSLTQALTLFGDNLFQSFVLSPLFLDAAINSGLIFLFVFLMQIFFSMGVLSGGRTSPLEAFFQGYLAPSVAVLGFTMSMLPGEGEIWLLIKSSICFSLLTFPLLFRWQVLSTWKDLSAQLQVARSLGASGSVLFWEISWPQLKGAVLQMSLVAAVWSLGDFAVTSFFFSGGKTMALIIVDLLNKYRMEWASFLSFLLFIFGLLTFYAFQRIFTHVRD